MQIPALSVQQSKRWAELWPDVYGVELVRRGMKLTVLIANQEVHAPGGKVASVLGPQKGRVRPLECPQAVRGWGKEG